MSGPNERIDPWRYTARYAVRQYELDVLGHVNNAVYLNWVEQVAVDHVEALGFGRRWAEARGGAWVVREHHVTYHRAVEYGDVVLVTTLPQQIGGVRGLRRTEIHREADGALMTEVATQWIWIRTSDGRPTRVPADLLALFDGGSAGAQVSGAMLPRSAIHRIDATMREMSSGVAMPL